jgi:hypothetical protein
MNRKEYLHFITEAMQIIGFLNLAYYMVHKERHKNKKRGKDAANIGKNIKSSTIIIKKCPIKVK